MMCEHMGHIVSAREQLLDQRVVPRSIARQIVKLREMEKRLVGGRGVGQRGLELLDRGGSSLPVQPDDVEADAGINDIVPRSATVEKFDCLLRLRLAPNQGEAPASDEFLRRSLTTGSRLPHVLIAQCHDLLALKMPEPEDRARVIARLMERECRRHDKTLHRVDPELLAAEVSAIIPENGFALAPARIRHLLVEPLLYAAKTGAGGVEVCSRVGKPRKVEEPRAVTPSGDSSRYVDRLRTAPSICASTAEPL